MHLFASAENGVVFELKPNPSPMQTELVRQPIVQVDGYVQLPSRPGLGIEVNVQTIEQYTLQWHSGTRSGPGCSVARHAADEASSHSL